MHSFLPTFLSPKHVKKFHYYFIILFDYFLEEVNKTSTTNESSEGTDEDLLKITPPTAATDEDIKSEL